MTLQVDTTVKIWDYLYRVRVPYLQSKSVEELRLYGTPLCGVKEIDTDIKNQWLDRWMSPAEMVRMYKEGVTVAVVSATDLREIYEDISRHINAWKTKLQVGINIGDSPIDDLIWMDKFANAVYEHAKYHFSKDEVNSLMAQHMNKVQRINASNFFTSAYTNKLLKETNGTTTINPVNEEYPDRDSLGEFFKSRLPGLRRFNDF